MAREGVMIMVRSKHPDRPIRVWLERWHMGVNTGDRGKSDLAPGGEAEKLRLLAHAERQAGVARGARTVRQRRRISAEVNAKAPGPRDPTRRFASRVAHYVRWRPGYPREIVGLLERECGLGPASVIADIGSGTGLLSRLLLEHGNPLFGVEPNTEMREAGAALLADCPRFTSVAASAEATTLAAASIDLIVAGQAFHPKNRSWGLGNAGCPSTGSGRTARREPHPSGDHKKLRSC